MAERETDRRETEDLEGYVQALIEGQGRLRAFIVAALGNQTNAADVLQRTNMVLWKKAREFRPDADFLPWALAIARYEVLGFLRDHQRDRHVFADDVVSLMLEVAADEVAEQADRVAALRSCLEKMQGKSRKLLWKRYSEDLSIKQIAQATGRSEDSIKSHLLRLRKRLEQCIQFYLKAGAA
jgi:RNA polymerase sigma-70 factor (ECF subfamily)